MVTARVGPDQEGPFERKNHLARGPGPIYAPWNGIFTLVAEARTDAVTLPGTGPGMPS